MQAVLQEVPPSAVHTSTEAASNHAALFLFRNPATAKSKQLAWRQGSLTWDVIQEFIILTFYLEDKMLCKFHACN